MRPTVPGACLLAALMAASPAKADALSDMLKAPVTRSQPGLAAPPAAAAPPPVEAPAAAPQVAAPPPAAVPAAVVPPAAVPEPVAVPPVLAVVPPAPDVVAPPPVNPPPAASGAVARLSREELRLRVEAATVFIVTITAPDKKGRRATYTGSGFFIDPQTIVTNSHVVEGAEHVFVAAPGSSRLDAEVVADTFVASNKRTDFAILRIDRPAGRVSLPIGRPVSSLTDVYSVGFPGIMVDFDAKADAFMRGDLQAIPTVVISSGAVQQVNEQTNGVEVVTHSALIHGGNSGGPLVDACGQVVGVNTWSANDFANVVTAKGATGAVAAVHSGYNLAQSVGEVVKFLGSRHQPFTAGGTCAD